MLFVLLVISFMFSLMKVLINYLLLLLLLLFIVYLMCEHSVINMCSQLTTYVNAGIMKGRWNACYACYNAFTNPSFLKNCSQPMASNLH